MKTFQMPLVADCAVGECAYNAKGACHARAITVGHELHPACDTFLRSAGEHSEDTADPAGVGACKVSGCRHNRGLGCGAVTIHVGYHVDHPDCLTFAAR